MTRPRDVTELLAYADALKARNAPVEAIAGRAVVAGEPYALAALAGETERVAAAAEGTRNDTLNIAAVKLGSLIAAGALLEVDVTVALTSAARHAGLAEREITATIASGLAKGTQVPRIIPERDTLPDLPDIGVFGEAEDGATDWAAAFPGLDWAALWADDTEDEWIVEPLIPAGRLIALYSVPKVGKSLLMLEVAVAVARGLPVLGTKPERPRRVLYVDLENDPRGDVRERLEDMGVGPGDLTDLIYLSFPVLAALDSPAGGAQLLAVALAHHVELIVVDTVSRVIRGEENENDTWLNFYRHTGLGLKRAHIALIRLDHAGKDEAKGQRGGSAKSGDVDAVWRLSKVTEDTFRLDCEAARMPIAEKTIVLHRETGPLRHRVDANGRAGLWDAKVAAVIAAMDEADLPPDAGAEKGRTVARGAGIRARNNVIAAAVRTRKLRFGPVPDLGDRCLSDDLSPRVRDRWGQVNLDDE